MIKNKISFLTALTISSIIAGSLSNPAYAVVNRPFAGTDRYDTALKIISNGWVKCDSAVISSGNDGNLVDALTAAPLARKLKAPVFLTDGISLGSSILNKLKSLGVKNVYITSGPAVISSGIENQLKSIGVTYIKRLGGADRYETSVNIAKALGTVGNIMVARGDEYADALSAAAIAAKEGMPILLSDKDNLPKSISDYISTQNINTSYVLGLQGALSDDVANKLPHSKRLGGQSRYETNINIIKEFEDEIDFSKVYVAAGENANLVDALAGSPLVSSNSSAIILSNSILPDMSAEYLQTMLNPDSSINIFGGLGAVPAAVSDKLNDIQKNVSTVTGSAAASVKTIITSVIKTISITSAPSSNCLKYRIAGSNDVISIGTPVTVVAPSDKVKVYFYSSSNDLVAIGTMDISSDSDNYKFTARLLK